MSSIFLAAVEAAPLPVLLPARLQMAFTLGLHIILACFGIGLPILMLIAEWLALKNNDRVWETMARRWSKAFAVLFAVGAVSGTVLSFELGLLWPAFMGRFGAVVGLPFTLEGFAFFTEAIFAGIYLYSWDRLPKRIHWLSGFPIAVSGFASAWFVVSANAWMNLPQGFTLTDGKLTAADPLDAMLNPATPVQATHMIIAAYIVTGFLVAMYYAWEILRGRNTIYQRRAMVLGFGMGALFSLFQLPAGDWSAKLVAKYQPVKFAALEGQYDTEKRAPLRIGGIPNDELEKTEYAIEIPGLLSWLAHGDIDARVTGLKDIPKDRRPPTPIVHFSFQIMVALGFVFILYGFWGTFLFFKRRERFYSKSFLWMTILSGPLAVLAMQAGWVVTEVGRQPWIVQGYMLTKDAVTRAPGIWGLFIITVIIYTVLSIGAILILQLLARRPLNLNEGEDHDA